MNRMKQLAAVLTLLGNSVPALAQPKPGAAELPVTRIILFSSGVGYYQREGQVEGSSRIDLQFPMSDINDLLKSLILQDAGGGQVGTVHYDNRTPIEKTLKSFAIDLTSNPSLGDLLNQARGEKVELVTNADLRAAVGQNETITGQIVGIEKQKQAVGKDQVIEVTQLNLLTTEGLRGVPLTQVQKVRFSKASLDQEFRKALEVLATGHDKLKKTVSLNFSGQGKRSVRVGYVTESPLWKTSYRLSLAKDKDKDKLFLQGWAIVENTTDEDWNNVHLGLVSGRPISFQMDLYQPLFVPRPVVEPELFASLRPQTYHGNMDKEAVDMPPDDAPSANAKKEPAAPPRPMEKLERMPEKDEAGKVARKMLQDATKSIDFKEGVASAATATELGEYFQYIIEQPVSLPRQKSALLPIVNEAVSGTKVSIYNESVHGKFPLLGLRFKNSTPLHLSQGPITVFENDVYAGDARIGDLQPNETRLLSYAIDLGTEVEPQQKVTTTLQKVKLVKGILHAIRQVRESKTYTVKNRSDKPRTVLIEHPFRSQFTLVEPKKAAERTREVYRFEVKAEPNQPVVREVVEEVPQEQAISLTNSDDESVRFFIRSSASSDKVKKALEQALTLKAKVNEAQRLIQIEDRALKIIEQDQTRMRANLAQVPPTSDAYKRYLKKFDVQETEIEKRRDKVTELQEAADKDRKAYEDFLAGLDVE